LFEDGKFVYEERLGEVDWFVVLNDLNWRGKREPVFAEGKVVEVRRCEKCASLTTVLKATDMFFLHFLCLLFCFFASMRS
jgi:hypothetical protein